MNLPVLGAAPVRMPSEVSCQFVPQNPNPGPMVNGNPLVQRKRPATCQPPSTASAAEFMPPANCLPRPKGSSYTRSEEHTSELQSRVDLVCRLLLEKKKIIADTGID